MLWFGFYLTEGSFPWLKEFGLRPRTLYGLIGIVTYPLLHSDLDHIVGNSITAIVLLNIVFSFYRKIAWQVILWSWLMSGTWMWVAARDGNHIGFSGVIYALASFIFFSGMIRKYYRLMALSGMIVFLYGSMIWGVLPMVPGVSWEGHLFGAIAGGILAYYYRERGPKRPKYSWEINPDEETNLPWNQIEIPVKDDVEVVEKPLNYRYLFKKASRGSDESIPNK